MVEPTLAEGIACINCFDGNGVVYPSKVFVFQADNGTRIAICPECFPEMAHKYMSDSELRSIQVFEEK